MFTVPEASAPFEFQIGTQTYSMPHVQSLPLAKVLAINEALKGKAGKALQDEMLNVTVDLFDQYAPGVTEMLSMEQFVALAKAYMDGEGEALGESSGSSD